MTPDARDGGGASWAATLVVCDLKGSTALAEQFDAETLRSVLSRYFDATGAVFVSHGGVIAKIIGDALVVVFDGSEDPAGAAWRASLAVLEARDVLDALNDRFVSTYGVRLENRTGVASGDLSSGDRDGVDADLLAGHVVQMAESLESAAPVGSALVDAATRRLLGDSAALESVNPVGSLDAWMLVEVVAGGTDIGDTDRAGDAMRCARCGEGNDVDDRRCSACGAVLDGGLQTGESRRTVTILFADPRPARQDGEPLDAHVTRAVMSKYFEVMRPILDRHGGTVEKFIGDAVMAVFGLPVRNEDDAMRAVRAAADMQAALHDLNDAVSDRFGVKFANPIGVNTGSVVAGNTDDGHRLVTGDAVNVAARLEQTARAGEVILGDLSYRLAGDAVSVEALEPLVLKGKAEPVPAFRLAKVVTAGGDVHRAHHLPLVGRGMELATMRQALGSAVDEGRPHRLTLLGDAGVGKSRLTHEFLAEAGRVARVVRGNCLAYGEGITFWPLLRVVQDAAGVEEGDDGDTARARLADLVGDEPEVLARITSVAGLVDMPYPVPELVWALRDVMERLATASPLVVVLDDVHWAEPTFLDVIDELATSVRGPVLFLCTARRTVLDQHREFVEAAPVVTLGPLTNDDCERFIHLLLGGGAVDSTTIARIVDAAAGNPLFLEQLLSMLIDDNRLQQVDGNWRVRGDLAELEVPASIEALLTARLDRLAAGERDTIEPASVIGRQFAVDALSHLVEPDLRTGLGGHLGELGDRGLVIALDDAEPTFRFEHQLIRDVTYNGLLKQSRAVLHERFVEWAEAKNASRDRSTEFDEILGYHLEQSHGYWSELGPLDDRAAGLGVRASQRLSAAGERALARGDMPAAANLLGRVAALLPLQDPGRPHVLLVTGNARHEIGAFDQAMDAYEESARAADGIGDLTAATAARIELLRLQYLIGRVDDANEVVGEVARALDLIGPGGDPDALSRIWQLQLNVDIAACRWSAAQNAADQVIAHARRAGNSLLAVRTMPLLAFLAQKGPMPVAEATSACEAILEQVEFDRRSWSLTQLELAVLSAMALDIHRARRLCDDTRRTLRDLGWEMQAALVSLSSGPIELLADEPGLAEAELRQDYDALDRLEERNFISLTAVLLAEAVYRQRRFDEAFDLVEFGEGLAAPDDLAVQLLARSVGGKLAARRGEPEAGLELVREAVRLMKTTDDPSGLGDMLVDYAEVLWLAGAAGAAESTAGEARASYLVKGNLAGAGRAERLRKGIARGLDPLPANVDR